MDFNTNDNSDNISPSSETKASNIQSSMNTFDMKDILELGEVLPDNPKVQFKSKKVEDTPSVIKNANNKFLIDTLSPQIEKNEDKKRKHKDVLLISVGVFISIQFILLAIMFFMVLHSIITCHIKGNPYSNDMIKLLFGFVSAYMTSIVVELIAMLKYIVTNVFDTSITGMVSLFKENSSSKEQEN